MEHQPLSTHPLFLDLTGKQYGRLLVLGFLGRQSQKYGKFKWWCRCDCGVERSVVGETLANGKTTSCGCRIHEKKTTETFQEQNKRYQKKYRAKNREARAEKLRDWRSKRADHVYAQSRDYAYRFKYGITYAQAEVLLASQGGCCQICGDEIKLGGTGGAVVDHDHDTGVVRGILCKPCNVGLGFLRDNEAILLSAIAYIKKSHRLRLVQRTA